MIDYREVTQAEIDEFWEPLESESDPRIPWRAVVSRNVVAALDEQEKDSKLWMSLKDGEVDMVWGGGTHPSGRDVYNLRVPLSDIVSDAIKDYRSYGPRADNVDLIAIAESLELAAKRVRETIEDVRRTARP